MSAEDKENNENNEKNIINEKIDKAINNDKINNTIFSYKKDLWMYFESINNKFIKDRQKSKSLIYILSQKNELTEEYSNNLELLYNQFFIELSYFRDEKNINDKDNKKYTFDIFLNAFLENIKKESVLFKDYSKLIKKILNSFEKNIKIQYEMNSHLNELIKTYEIKFKSIIQNVKKYKDEYEKAGKSVEKTKKDYEIMNEEIKNQNGKNEANNLKYKKCVEENNQKMQEAKEKQKNYEDYLVIANKEREKYIELSEKVYDLAQKLDSEYIDLIKNNIKSLLNSETDIFNKIIEENKSMINNINLFNINDEIEQFANTKFPKFSLPKPFVYEPYTPYLYIRERQKSDNSNTENQDIYKIIVNDLNHLFLSKKYTNLNDKEKNSINENNNKSNNEKKTNIEEIDYIRNIVHEIWNSKKIDFKRFKNLVKNDDLRFIFLTELNHYRSEGMFILDKISYDNLAEIFNIVINISNRVKDFESIKSCMILSQTFYKSLNDDKIYLQKEVMKNEIWIKKDFWKDIIEFSIKNEINNPKEYLVFLEEDEVKREERVKNAVNGVLVTFSVNMKFFKVPLKERKEIIDMFIQKYGIKENPFFNDDEIDIHEAEEEILVESVASNLDIEPKENENDNQNKE